MLQVIKQSHAGIAKKYRLHDLLRDFCIAKAKNQSVLEVFSSMDQSTLDGKVASLQARRATFHSGISLSTQNPHLRSLIRFGKSGPCFVGKSNFNEHVRMSMNVVYKSFKLLRVLYLCGIETSSGELSKEVGDLIHLRYLAIKATNINMFPKAIANLRNLMTLDFRWNKGEGKIAFTLSNRTRIQHICLGWRDKVLTENLGLDKLKDLQTLKGINGGKWMIKEMNELSRSMKKLQIWGMSSMECFSYIAMS